MKNILVAPLNWGLGHATRCIPIINNLIKEGFNPIIASDGEASKLLKVEFPDLIHLDLPSYNIKLTKKPSLLKLKLFLSSPNSYLIRLKENKIVKKWVKEYNLIGIISDNRPGVYSNKIPSVYITHQINVLSGNTTWLTSLIHKLNIERFNECWVPDFRSNHNISGKLGHPKKKLSIKTKYIGPLSRFTKKNIDQDIDLTIILSGPEPQRSLLEKKLKQQLHYFSGNIHFINGIVEDKKTTYKIDNITFYNYLNSQELENILNRSKLIISRSGYSSIMDYAILEKKAILIPTPGQYEQEYLAKRLKKLGLFNKLDQNNINLKKLEKSSFYNGIKNYKNNTNWNELFSIFK